MIDCRTPLIVALALGLVAGCGAGVPVDSKKEPADGSVTHESRKPLVDTGPLRRLGDSEFRLTSNDGYERPFCFSPDGKLIAAANWYEVRMWSFPDGKLRHDFSDEVQSKCVGFSADGREFLAFDERDDSILRFEVESGRLNAKIPLTTVADEKRLDRESISGDGRWLCATSERGNVVVWDTLSGKVQCQIDPERMSPRLAPVSKDGILTLWDGLFLERHDLATCKRLHQSRHYRRLLDPISNSDGTVMAAYSTEDQAIVFWNPETDQRVGGKIPAEEREWRPGQAALSADGRRFVYWIKNGKWIFDRTMAVFDVATGDLIREFAPPDVYFVEEPVISPDGRYVFPSGGRSVFNPVDTDTGKPFRDAPDHVLKVESLSFTPNGKTLIVGSGDKRQAWDIETGRPGTVFESWHHVPYLTAVDDRRALISGLRGGGVRLQDIHTGAVERRYQVDEDTYLSAFQLGADRKSFVGLTQRQESTIQRWDIETGEVIAEWTMPTDSRREYGLFARYAYPGPILGGSRLIRVEKVQPAKKLPNGGIDWGRSDLLLEDWTTQQVTARLALPTSGERLNFGESMDGKTLAAIVSEGVQQPTPGQFVWGSSYLIIWDVATKRERLRVKRPMTEYLSAFANIAITPDVRLAATSSYRDRIEIWNASTGKLLQTFESENEVSKLAFTDDGTVLASGHQDGSVFLWDTRAAWKYAGEDAIVAPAGR